MRHLRSLFIKSTFIFSTFLFNFFPNAYAETNPEKELLAETIKIYSSISKQDDIKTKLLKQESTIKKLDEMIELHSSTDIGLLLLTTGKFGKYNSDKVRTDYLNNLVSFNLKTCESSPSYSCLGFVSLANATKACEKPDGFSSYISASNNFKNAYKVFKGQGDAEKYALGVLTGYTNCANNAGGVFEKDYVNSKLIKVLLENGDESKAIGITQQMETSLFKILSAAYIREAQGKYDIPTYSKLYKKAKLVNDNIDRAAAKLILGITAIEAGIDIDSGAGQMLGDIPTIGLPSLGELRMSGIDLKSCNSRQKFLSEIAMDFLMSGASYRLDVENIAIACSNYVVFPILYWNSPYEGNRKYIARSIREFMSEQKVYNLDATINFYLKAIPENLIIKYLNDKEKGLNGTQLKPDPLNYHQPYPFVSTSEYAQYSIFKLYADAEDVCRATKYLFKRLKGTEYETQAVDYFVSNPNISQDKKYICGDEDLDLLIN